MGLYKITVLLVLCTFTSLKCDTKVEYDHIRHVPMENLEDRTDLHSKYSFIMLPNEDLEDMPQENGSIQIIPKDKPIADISKRLEHLEYQIVIIFICLLVIAIVLFTFILVVCILMCWRKCNKRNKYEIQKTENAFILI